MNKAFLGAYKKGFNAKKWEENPYADDATFSTAFHRHWEMGRKDKQENQWGKRLPKESKPEKWMIGGFDPRKEDHHVYARRMDRKGWRNLYRRER